MIERIVKHEGGYANDPRDRGGETYKGIARNFWPKWEGWKLVDEAKPGTVKEINQRLEKTNIGDMVLAFYKKEYWDKVGAPLLGDALGFQVTDCAVNCGIARAAKMLQRLVGAYPDGAVGPMTAAKVKEYGDTLEVITGFNEARREYYRGLKQFSIYGKGWLNRVDANDALARHDCQGQG